MPSVACFALASASNPAHSVFSVHQCTHVHQCVAQMVDLLCYWEIQTTWRSQEFIFPSAFQFKSEINSNKYLAVTQVNTFSDCPSTETPYPKGEQRNSPHWDQYQSPEEAKRNLRMLT